MYDDWAYRAETSSQQEEQVSDSTSSTTTLKAGSGNRPRARSLLQSVAIDGEDHSNGRNHGNGKINGSFSGSGMIPSRASVKVRRAKSLNRGTNIWKVETRYLHDSLSSVNGQLNVNGKYGSSNTTVATRSSSLSYPFTEHEYFKLDNLIDFFSDSDAHEVETEKALNDFVISNVNWRRKDQDIYLAESTSDSEIDVEIANIYPYILFSESSNLHSNSCNGLIRTCDSVINYLDELSKGFREVRLETTEFESTCHSLISEQTHLANLSRDVEVNLEIFTTLEKAMRILHSPGSDLPGRSSFKPLLADLDKGLAYFVNHPKILDLDLYQMRYRQCLTRALTLAVEYFNNRLNNNARTIESKISLNKNLNATAHDALIYATFESDASQLKGVAHEVFIRSQNNKEYSALYDGCLYTYFGIRKKLLMPIINKNFEESGAILTGNNSSFVQTCRASLSFFQEEIYIQEYRLFKSFFTCSLEVFENWLGDLSEPLYDNLRQRIIREQNIDNLCELTSLLITYKEDEEEQIETSNFFPPSNSVLPSDSIRQLNTSHLFQPILEDVQSRLVFRVQTSVEQDIVKYTPKTTDIVTLGGRRKLSTTNTTTTSISPSSGDTTSAMPANNSTPPGQTPTPPTFSKEKEPKFDTDRILHDLYHPMRKAVSLLARIYQLVNSKVFDDLAHTIVHESLLAIKRALPLAIARLGPIEADLFLVKNLLMLRSQVVEYEIDNVPAEIGVDFSGLQEVFSTIRQEGVSFASSNLLNLARSSVPKVVNNMLDAKEELYAELRNAIHDLTQHSVTTVAQAIIGKADPATALEDTRKLRQDATVELPRIRSMIENYITDERTIDVLMDSIQDLVIQTYEGYHQQIVSKASKSEDIDGLMEVDGLVSWLGDIVGRLHSAALANRKVSVGSSSVISGR